MERKKVRLLGEVLVYREESDLAEVRLVGEGLDPILTQIETFRLKAKNLNYSGANFFYDVVDEGACRTVKITPNTTKNEEGTRELKKMVGKYKK
jgi:hypothetical protein